MFLVRVRGVLLNDYLMQDVDLAFASISHGVAFHVERTDRGLEASIARDMPAARLVVECYDTARDVLDGFVRISSGNTFTAPRPRAIVDAARA